MSSTLGRVAARSESHNARKTKNALRIRRQFTQRLCKQGSPHAIADSQTSNRRCPVAFRTDAGDVYQIDDFGRTIIVGYGKRASARNEPEVIGMADPKLTLVGKKNRERLKGRLLLRSFDLFSRHSVTSKTISPSRCFQWPLRNRNTEKSHAGISGHRKFDAAVG